MANVKTFNLSIWFKDGRDLTFRDISRVAVARYIKYYEELGTSKGYHVEERN